MKSEKISKGKGKETWLITYNMGPRIIDYAALIWSELLATYKGNIFKPPKRFPFEDC